MQKWLSWNKSTRVVNFDPLWFILLCNKKHSISFWDFEQEHSGKMEDIITNTTHSGIHILSYIGICSLMFSVACILFIAITCCFNILLNNLGLQWVLNRIFFRRRTKEDHGDSDPSSGLLAKTKPVHLRPSVLESTKPEDYLEP